MPIFGETATVVKLWTKWTKGTKGRFAGGFRRGDDSILRFFQRSHQLNEVTPGMSLLSICQWLQNESIGTSIRESVWTFPAIETVHLLALAFSVGIIVFVDLRLIGFTMIDQPVTEVFERLQPLALKGFAINVLSGMLLFWSEPLKCYNSWFFRAKLIMLLILGINAVLFSASTYKSVAEWDKAAIAPVAARVAGWVSLAFWAGVIIAGRAIAYYATVQ